MDADTGEQSRRYQVAGRPGEKSASPHGEVPNQTMDPESGLPSVKARSQ